MGKYINCIITESLLFLIISLGSMRFMIIEPTGIPVISQFVSMSSCWRDLAIDSEEDGVLLEYQRPQS